MSKLLYLSDHICENPFSKTVSLEHVRFSKQLNKHEKDLVGNFFGLEFILN